MIVKMRLRARVLRRPWSLCMFGVCHRGGFRSAWSFFAPTSSRLVVFVVGLLSQLLEVVGIIT